MRKENTSYLMCYMDNTTGCVHFIYSTDTCHKLYRYKYFKYVNIYVKVDVLVKEKKGVAKYSRKTTMHERPGCNEVCF